MLNLRKVAITGGLASGKSSVCRFFKECGAYVVSADQLVHILLSPDTNLGQQIITLLGQKIVVESKIDRSKIAEKVFNKPHLLRKLEEILHPIIRQEIEKHYAYACEQNQSPLFVVEIPLLYETANEGWYDVVIVVDTPQNICIERFVAATGSDAGHYHQRMQQQIDPKIKASKANYVIPNQGSLEQLKKMVRKIYQELTSQDIK